METPGAFALELVGGTLDLHAGQLVDRVGVAMGLPFPAGPGLEELARQADGSAGVALKAKVVGAHCNLSGAETAAQRLIAAGADHASVAWALQRCLAETFAAMALNAAREHKLSLVTFIGGVASNGAIREHVRQTLARQGIETRFAPPGLSSDNAVGVAFLGQQFLR